jgi:hypothetical protein
VAAAKNIKSAVWEKIQMHEYYKKKSEDMFSIVAVGILGCTLIIGTIIIILFS